jgi:hypothetical protein
MMIDRAILPTKYPSPHAFVDLSTDLQLILPLSFLSLPANSSFDHALPRLSNPTVYLNKICFSYLPIEAEYLEGW